MEKRIVIIGGGFGGARAAQDLVKAGFSNVSLIDKKDYFEVNYVALHSLTYPEALQHARKKYTDFLNGDFYHADVQTVNKNSVTLSDHTEIPFDIALVVTGSSYRTFPIGKSHTAMTIGARNQEFLDENAKLQRAQKILIIGGGPVGTELAGEIAYNYPNKSVTLAESGNRLLRGMKPKAGHIAVKNLRSKGVEILFNTRLSPDDHRYRDADLVYICVGLTPNTKLMKEHFANSIDDAGYLKVDPTFRVAGTDNIYALGDCSDVPGIKLGFFANMQGAHFAKNLMREARGKAPKPYKPFPDTALVPLGGGDGVFQIPFIGVTDFKPLIGLRKNDHMIQHLYHSLGTE